MAQQLLDIHQLADKYPALKKWGIRWLVRNRRIPIVRIGRRIFFDPKDISDWLDANKIVPTSKGGKKEK
ncbi:MAG: hypothetical protein ACM3SR_05530 [Ignavibacteriales bacterium]